MLGIKHCKLVQRLIERRQIELGFLKKVYCVVERDACGVALTLFRLPIVGVNTFLPEHGAGDENRNAELIRSTEEEKAAQVIAVRAYNDAHAAAQEPALMKLQATAAAGGNVFAELMETVKSASLGRISRALDAVGGQYRRNM